MTQASHHSLVMRRDIAIGCGVFAILRHRRGRASEDQEVTREGGGWGGEGEEEKEQQPTLCLTLSRESGVSTEKPIRMTCAFEYASGRNRS